MMIIAMLHCTFMTAQIRFEEPKKDTIIKCSHTLETGARGEGVKTSDLKYISYDKLRGMIGVNNE